MSKKIEKGANKKESLREIFCRLTQCCRRSFSIRLQRNLLFIYTYKNRWVLVVVLHVVVLLAVVLLVVRVVVVNQVVILVFLAGTHNIF